MLTQMAKITPLVMPRDFNNVAMISQVFGLQEYGWATIILQYGNVAGNTTITVEECDALVPTIATPIGFQWSKTGAFPSDTLSALAKATVAGVVVDAAVDDNRTFVLEIDASNLSAGRPYLRVRGSNPGAVALLLGGVAVLTEARYLRDIPPSAID